MAELKTQGSGQVAPDVVRLPEHLHQEKDGLWYAEFGSFRIRTTFQPIYRRSAGSDLILEGVEGFVRGTASGLEYDRDRLCEQIPDHEMYRVGWICRAIQFRNFALSGGGTRKIFVPLAAMSAQEYSNSAYDFELMPQRLGRFGLTARQVVIEISNEVPPDVDVLKDIVEIHRTMGAAVALCGFGSRETDVERLNQLKPEMVKIDSGLLEQAVCRSDMTQLVRSLVSMAVDLGAEVIIDGVDTRSKLEFVFSTAATLLQGGLLGSMTPQAGLHPPRLDTQALESDGSDPILAGKTDFA